MVLHTELCVNAKIPKRSETNPNNKRPINTNKTIQKQVKISASNIKS